MFSKYGSISDVYIPLDYHTREPRGFAYIQYPCCQHQAASSSPWICFISSIRQIDVVTFTLCFILMKNVFKSRS
ncbi:Serine/arginine-rich splicing factor 10 [Holothuria leucospilota]|uniref:Serine/arginine-rich splicing factor 10 n=1 Tax=Holothuria leucospilota TaxID=206669 RepID=A0A9Q0YNV7_HOLLE|nr:Serine/arginine-rich splicing factor 10 [Holothuria leucospilota]